MLGEHDAQYVVRIGEIRLQAHGRVQVFACQLVKACPSRDESEKIQRVKPAAIPLHDLTANLRRLLQVARLVAIPGCIDRLWARKLSHRFWRSVLGTGLFFTDARIGRSSVTHRKIPPAWTLAEKVWSKQKKQFDLTKYESSLPGGARKTERWD